MVSPIDPFGVGVPELPGDPPERFTQLEHERREGVPRLVHRTGPQFCATERWAPHALTEVGDIEWPTVPVGPLPKRLLSTLLLTLVVLPAVYVLAYRRLRRPGAVSRRGASRENNPARLEAVG